MREDGRALRGHACYRALASSRIMAAPFSAIMIVGALVMPEVMVGIGVDHPQAAHPDQAQPLVDHLVSSPSPAR